MPEALDVTTKSRRGNFGLEKEPVEADASNSATGIRVTVGAFCKSPRCEPLTMRGGRSSRVHGAVARSHAPPPWSPPRHRVPTP